MHTTCHHEAAMGAAAGATSKNSSKLCSSQLSRCSNSFGTLSFTFCPLNPARSMYRSVTSAADKRWL